MSISKCGLVQDALAAIARGDHGPVSVSVTHYCRWCHESFDRLSECHQHQDQCADRGVYRPGEAELLRELTFKQTPLFKL